MEKILSAHLKPFFLEVGKDEVWGWNGDLLVDFEHVFNAGARSVFVSWRYDSVFFIRFGSGFVPPIIFDMGV